MKEKSEQKQTKITKEETFPPSLPSLPSVLNQVGAPYGKVFVSIPASM
jgi:hypothetical protein